MRYELLELGVLHPDRGVAELRVSHRELVELVEHGDAEPADSPPDSNVLRHEVEGPADVTAVLELFDRRYRDVRGDEGPYSSQDPAQAAGPHARAAFCSYCPSGIVGGGAGQRRVWSASRPSWIP